MRCDRAPGAPPGSIPERAVDAAALECRGLRVGVPGRTLVAGLDLQLAPGEVLAVLGRIGSGKSTTLGTLAGLRPADAGEVRLAGRPLATVSRRARARELGLLPQTEAEPFPGTVLDAALVGRHPHIGFWAWETPRDREIALACLARTGLAGLERREVSTLSGGERRRLAVAALLAQQPRVCLLDEPLQNLDVHHQLELLVLVRELAGDGRAVALSLHDPGLAARFADRALLLFGDGRWLLGEVAGVLGEATLAELYGVGLRELRWPGGRTFVTA